MTDRCDFRCVYCMSEDMTFLPRKDLLSLEELDRLGSAFVGLGTRRIRITGGEPLVRKGIMQLFRSLGCHLGNGLKELTLTTNASQFPGLPTRRSAKERLSDEENDTGVKAVTVNP